MGFSLHKDTRGVVLIMVLAVIVLFTAMVIEFMSDQTTELEMAYNFKDSLQAYYCSISGLEAAKVLLKEDDDTYDASDEEWARFSEYALAANALLDGPVFTGVIGDECAKFDLNSLVKSDGTADDIRRQQFMSIFHVLAIDISDDELGSLVDALIDWIDPDDAPTGSGAEDSYYQGLDDPYECKNDPMDTINEILLVKGMKKEYLYGTEEYKGIKEYVTVATNGMINVNTASREVLLALTDNEDLVDLIIEDREEEPFKLQDQISSILQNSGLPQSTIDTLKEIMTVKSTRFLVKVRGAMPSGAVLDLEAVLSRGSGNVQTLYYRIE